MRMSVRVFQGARLRFETGKSYIHMKVEKYVYTEILSHRNFMYSCMKNVEFRNF